jgi:hypothetical protein
MIKSRRMRRQGHGVKRNAYGVLIGKPEERGH